MLFRGLDDDVAAVQVDGGPLPSARYRHVGALIHLNQRSVEETNHGIRTFCGTDLVAIANLVARWNHTHVLVGHRIE